MTSFIKRRLTRAVDKRKSPGTRRNLLESSIDLVEANVVKIASKHVQGPRVSDGLRRGASVTLEDPSRGRLAGAIFALTYHLGAFCTNGVSWKPALVAAKVID